jgi:hypothetical protein
MKRWILDGTVLTEAVAAGLRLAASERPPHAPLDTRAALHGLMRADTAGEWERIWLHTGGLDGVAGSKATDPDAEPGGLWENVPVTGSLAEALDCAERIAGQYRLRPLSPGVVALGLIADPRAAASCALLEGTRLSRRELVDLVQDTLLGGALEGIEALLGADPGPAGPAAPPGEVGFTEAALAEARRVAGPGRDPDAACLLAATVTLQRDERLTEAFGNLLLDAEELESAARAAAGRPSEPATAVVERAREWFDGADPDAAQLVVGATVQPVEAVRRALWYLGLTPAELAIDAAVADRERRDGGREVSRLTFVLTVVNLLATLTVCGLVVREAASSGDWWKLALILPAWWGHPEYSPVVGLGVAGLLWAVIGPVAAAVQLAVVLLDLALADSERRTLFGAIGFRPSLQQLRSNLTRRKRPYRQYVRVIFLRWRRTRAFQRDLAGPPA